MTLTKELDSVPGVSPSVNCNSKEKAFSMDADSTEFKNSTYLHSASEDDPILDAHLDCEDFLKIEFVEEGVFDQTPTLSITSFPVVSFSEETIPKDEEKAGNDFVIPQKRDLRSKLSGILKRGDTATLSRRDYLMVLATFFIALIAKGNSAGLSVLTVEWLQEFEKSKALILYVPALNFAITSAAGIIDGILINRFGIFPILLLGCLLQVFCMIASSFSTNAITLVIVLGSLAGLGNCFLFVNAFIFISVHFGEVAKPIIAFISVAGPIGGLIFPNLIAFFIELYGWRGCMFILAGINLQIVPLAIFLTFAQKEAKIQRRSSEVENKRNPEVPQKLLDLSVLKNFLFVMYVFSVGLTVGGINSVFSMLPDFLYEKGLDLKGAARLYALYYILSAVPRILIGIAMKYTKVNFIHIYITMSSLFGLTMALMNLAETYVILLVCCILWALWMGCPAGLYAIGIMELVGPEKHSSGQSIVETSYGLTTALFGFLAGLLVEYTNSYRQPFYIYGTAIILINIALLITTSAQQLRLKLGFFRLVNK